jgi:hypothetical protein
MFINNHDDGYLIDYNRTFIDMHMHVKCLYTYMYIDIHEYIYVQIEHSIITINSPYR